MKTLQHHKVVLFDHDGTVVDSETIALESAWRLTNEVAREFPGAQHYELDFGVKGTLILLTVDFPQGVTQLE